MLKPVQNHALECSNLPWHPVSAVLGQFCVVQFMKLLMANIFLLKTNVLRHAYHSAFQIVVSTMRCIRKCLFLSVVFY